MKKTIIAIGLLATLQGCASYTGMKDQNIVFPRLWYPVDNVHPYYLEQNEDYGWCRGTHA